MNGQVLLKNSASIGTHFAGIDYLELYVGNARQAAYYYQSGFGFTPIAYAGPETGIRDRISLVLAQGEIRLVLTSAIGSDGEIAAHFLRHDDGVKDIALTVADARRAFAETVGNGARPVLAPKVEEDEHGQIVKATVAVFGDTVHSFIERRGYAGVFAPGYQIIPESGRARYTGLNLIDHLAISVEPGEGNKWVDFYTRAFGLQHTQSEDISSEYSGMKTDVVRGVCEQAVGSDGKDENGRVVFVIVEPVAGQRRSPIDEYLTYYNGAGVHHIGLRSENIVTTVETLRENGVGFARTPGTYYDVLGSRAGEIDIDSAALRKNEILLDCDEWGYLLQIFAKPAQTRPTYFFEIIQRQKARGFGNGNIKALFEAIEREQLARGNV